MRAPDAFTDKRRVEDTTTPLLWKRRNPVHQEAGVQQDKSGPATATITLDLFVAELVRHGTCRLPCARWTNRLSSKTGLARGA